MADPAKLLADVVNRGFEWVKARDTYRKVCDSKSATKEAEKKAGTAALEAAAKLEKALIELRSISGGMAARKRGATSAPVDWSKLAGAIAKGAGVVEDVLKRKGPFVDVIDTEGREVK